MQRSLLFFEVYSLYLGWAQCSSGAKSQIQESLVHRDLTLRQSEVTKMTDILEKPVFQECLTGIQSEYYGMHLTDFVENTTEEY